MKENCETKGSGPRQGGLKSCSDDKQKESFSAESVLVVSRYHRARRHERVGVYSRLAIDNYGQAKLGKFGKSTLPLDRRVCEFH